LLQSLPNRPDGTFSGDGILLHWRRVGLQFPQTNNVGFSGSTDARCWRAEGVDHPQFQRWKGAT